MVVVRSRGHFAQYPLRRQVSHAAVMPQRAGPLAAAQAIQRVRSIGPRTLGFSIQTGNVGPNSVMTGLPRAAAMCRGPLSVETISRQRARQPLVSPRLTAWAAREKTRGEAARGDCSGSLALAGSAKHEYVAIQLLDDLSGQGGAVLDRPELGRSESAGGVQGHEPSVVRRPRSCQTPWACRVSAAVTFNSSRGDSSGPRSLGPGRGSFRPLAKAETAVPRGPPRRPACRTQKPRTTGAFSDAHMDAARLLGCPGNYSFDDLRYQEQHDGAAEVFAHGFHVASLKF